MPYCRVRTGADYRMTQGVLPIRWTAPEGLDDQKFSSASDVWSFAITCVEIIQDGLVPYADVRSNPALIALVTGGEIHPRPDGCSDAVYAMLVKCWSFAPLDRPDFHELREFFQCTTPGALSTDPAGGVFLAGGAHNQYTALEGGGDDGHADPPPVPYGQSITLPPRAAPMRRKKSMPKLYSGGNVGPGMIPTEYLPVGKPNPVEHRAEGSNLPDREQEEGAANGYLEFGFGEEAVHPTAGSVLQADADLAPHGSPAVKLHATGGLEGATRFAADGSSTTSAATAGGGETRKAGVTAEYLTIGKQTGMHPDAKPGAGVTAALRDDGENFDGFYEHAPDLAAHDRAVREALGKGDSGVATAPQPLGLRTLHIDGIGDVDVYDEAQPNSRDATNAGAPVASMGI